MQQLSPGQREVLALRFSDEELTSEQVAEVLGKKPGAIREMQSAAIKKLRMILAAEVPQE
jgi:DNA-directed RNA polymerase specialized sigma24 family protein